MDSRLRNQVLAEWRGLREPPAPPDRGRPVSAAMEEVMRRLGLADRLHEAQVLSAWKEIVGDFLAAHSCPSALREGVLYVQVLQPSVHFELDRNHKKLVLQRLKDRFGAGVIRKIQFRVG